MSVEMPRTHCSRWLAMAGSFCAVTRNDGPETLTAATGNRCASSTGTAMQRRPSFEFLVVDRVAAAPRFVEL